MANLQERIAGLEEHLRVLKARQQRLLARERRLTAQRERHEDTRRKILVGAMILEHIEQGRYSREALKAALDRFLTREADRALFELPESAPRERAEPSRDPRRVEASPSREPLRSKG